MQQLYIIIYEIVIDQLNQSFNPKKKKELDD